jgi:hypothetical protein
VRDASKTGAPEHARPPEYGATVWWSLGLVAGSIVGVILIALRLGRRFGRYQRDIDDELGREYRDPPHFHDRAGPH